LWEKEKEETEVPDAIKIRSRTTVDEKQAAKPKNDTQKKLGMPNNERGSNTHTHRKQHEVENMRIVTKKQQKKQNPLGKRPKKNQEKTKKNTGGAARRKRRCQKKKKKTNKKKKKKKKKEDKKKKKKEKKLKGKKWELDGSETVLSRIKKHAQTETIKKKKNKNKKNPKNKGG